MSERDDQISDPCVADVESHRQAIDRSGIVNCDAVFDADRVIVGNRERSWEDSQEHICWTQGHSAATRDSLRARFRLVA